MEVISVDVRLDEPQKRGSSFVQATFNSVNVMLGISFLSTPYALERGGWLGLSILFLFALMCCYTAFTLGHCIAITKKSYNEIAEEAFGPRARAPFTVLFYFELIAVLVGYTISLADNLARLFPHASLRIFTFEVGPSKALLLLAFVVILPTVWLRDLTMMSYVSLAGVLTYLVVAVTIACAGVFNGIGFDEPLPVLRTQNLLHVVGIYAYCFAAHCVFPSIYTSLKKPSLYPKVLSTSFLITTGIYTGFAILGGKMFGSEILSQVSLNIPRHLLAAKIVLWLVVFIPVTKYSLCIAPMAVEIESKFPWPRRSKCFLAASVGLRTTVMLVIVLLAMLFPDFETMIAFIGSASGMLLAIILPTAFYLKLFGRSMPRWEIVLNVAILVVGVGVGTSGTVVSIMDLLKK